jgi:Cd2+/Zn2+-exporting ATPase
LIEELGICNADAETALTKLETKGKTAIILSSETAPLIVIGVADPMRGTSSQAINICRELT